MKINDIPEQGRQTHVPLQLIRIMKLTAIIITFCLIQVSAATKAQITLNEKKASLQKVLESISTQSGYDFIYSTQDLKDLKTGTIKLNNVDIETALKAAFDGQPLQYEIADKTVMVKRKEDKTVTERVKDFVALVDVHGRVVDEKGQALLGVTIQLKDRSQVTTTDKEGYFNLKRVNDKAVLVISFIGYLTKEINASAEVGTITLEITNAKLDEVVILAYSRTTNRELTGNVSKVKAKDIEYSPVNNPILAIAGRVPGVQITQATGFAGSGVNIIIQGLNSLQKGVTPFYVIDGVPYVQSLMPNFGNVLGISGNGAGDGSATGNPLSYINTADIESIEILKDADATAIYGSRAANGAIIITTKKGKEGRMQIGANFQTGYSQVARKLQLLNTSEYLAMRREAYANDGTTSYLKSDYDINGTWDTTKYTDWQKELIGNKANYNDLQLNISGGNTNVTYLIGGSYHKEKSVFPSDLGDTKAGVRFSIDATSNNKKFTVSLSGSYLNDNNRLPVNDLTLYAMTLPPNLPDLKNPDGSLNWATNSSGASTINPHPLANLTETYSNKTSNLLSNAVLNYKLISGLSLKANIGYNILQTDEIRSIPLTAYIPERRAIRTRFSDFGFNKITSWIIEPQFIYNKEISRGDLNVIIGSSFQETNKSRNIINAKGFASDDVLGNLSAATSISTVTNSSIISDYKYNAAFFQANYNWEKKYIINLSGRRDGSSRFGTENRFHNFGAAGLAWVFSEEKIIKQLLPLLSFGKLKGSFGTTGNDQIGDYTFLSLYQFNNRDIPYRNGSSLTINQVNNPYLQWEETRKLSIGLDLGFMQDRILLNSTIYRNRSSNMLVIATAPAIAAPPGTLVVNLPAVVQNSGIEFSLTSINLKNKSLFWSTNLNLTFPKNQLYSFPNLESSVYAFNYSIGQPIDIIKTYRANGVNSQTGIYEFLDKSGKITDNPQDDFANYNKIINTDPKYYGGLSNTISYKGLTIDFLFQFVKQMGRNLPYDATLPGSGLVNFDKRVLDRWHTSGDMAPVQKLTTSNFDYYSAYFNQYNSDAYYEDASFIRLKNVSLSYTVPSYLISKAGIQSCKLFLTGQNLLTITPYKGLDPESQGNFSLPPLRVFTLGVQATF